MKIVISVLFSVINFLFSDRNIWEDFTFSFCINKDSCKSVDMIILKTAIYNYFRDFAQLY